MVVNKPVLLTDKNRLKEIYDLRVIAYEHSYKSVYINKQAFPDGWRDGLDEDALHWIVEDGGNIIASARLAMLNDLNETGENLEDFAVPNERPFAYFSRLVVHPDYQGLGLSRALDVVRLNYIVDKHIPFALAFSFTDRIKALLQQGFVELGIINFKWNGAPLPLTDQHLLIFSK